MDLYALAAVLAGIASIIGLVLWGIRDARSDARDTEKRAGAGDLRAAAAELREEQAARKRADALAEERRRRVVALEQGAAQVAERATADAAAVDAIDAALPARPGGPVDLGAALDGLLPSTAAGSGRPDRGPAAPAGPGPGAPPPA